MPKGGNGGKYGDERGGSIIPVLQEDSDDGKGDVAYIANNLTNAKTIGIRSGTPNNVQGKGMKLVRITIASGATLRFATVDLAAA